MSVKRFLPYFVYFLFWLVFFVITKVVFLLYHLHLTSDLGADTIGAIFLHGLRMDASFAAYICIFPFLLYLMQILFPRFRVHHTIKIYSLVLIVCLSFLTVADLELYTAWGFRMDATPLMYFKSPKEMMGTISSAPLLQLSLIFLVICFVFIYLLPFFNIRPGAPKRNFFHIFFGVFLIAVLFVPIRGGIQKIPLNISDAYFTDNLFADHAAINLPWNIAFSILNRNNDKNPFQYFPDKEARGLVDKLYRHKNSGASILTTTRPNIIFVIMESFTAKLVGRLGGVEGVTPRLDSIAEGGLLFTNIYASGDRSEKGQVAILSGYPNQGINSIIKTPNKTSRLPGLARTLKSYGYTCSYTYGGELEFANIKSYLINTGYKEMLSKYSFPATQRTTSWGVHDQYVFNRFYDDLKTEPQPFFATIFSLSSHEPYDVPLEHIKKSDEVSRFENAVYYADSVLGDFINKIKNESFWKNTLIVITADHGHPFPGNDPVDVPSKFHIPLVFTGGALKKTGTVGTVGSQTDIITTVLNQMEIPSAKFKWGADLLDSARNAFAFYDFNNGFGWITKDGFATVDNVSRRIIHASPGFDTSALRSAKAYMQVSYQDYLDR